MHRSKFGIAAGLLGKSSDFSAERRLSLLPLDRACFSFRSALPDLDPKRASKWAAAMELADSKQVTRKDFVEFIEGEGGVEGAARTRARLRALEAEGWLR